MSRIFFLNRFFAPDHSATSQLVADVAFHLAASGHDVHVVTSQQLYDQPKTQLLAQETIDGVHIHRVRTTRFGRSKLVGRAADYISFYFSAWWSLLSFVNRGDVLVAMTDPPLVSIVAMMVARHRGAKLINWLQDLYPEIARELAVPLVRGGPIFRVLCYLRDRCLQFASANVVVGQLMANKVAARKIAASRIHVIPNWCRDEQIVPIAPADNPLRRDWSFDHQFVVGYSGNLGRAHEFHTMLAAADLLRNNSEIVFLFIGGGHHIRELGRQAKERGLNNFRFVDYQNQSVLKFSLGVPDVHWLSLRPELEGLVVPSKFYGIAAAGKPVIAICSKDGEIARLIQEHGCGFVVEPGNDVGLAQMLLKLATDAGLRTNLGHRARTMIETHFARDLALKRWRQVLKQTDIDAPARYSV